MTYHSKQQSSLIWVPSRLTRPYQQTSLICPMHPWAYRLKCFRVPMGAPHFSVRLWVLDILGEKYHAPMVARIFLCAYGCSTFLVNFFRAPMVTRVHIKFRSSDLINLSHAPMGVRAQFFPCAYGCSTFFCAPMGA